MFKFIKRKFRERRERILEKGFIEKSFGLEIDTDILQINLCHLRQNLANASKEDMAYISRRLTEKANLIREGYDDGKFDFIADDFKRTADSLRTGYTRDCRRICFDFSYNLSIN